MADLLIEVDEEILHRLSVRAEQHGVTLEDEAREVLINWANDSGPGPGPAEDS